MVWCEIFNILFSYENEDTDRFSNLDQCTFKTIRAFDFADSNEAFYLVCGKSKTPSIEDSYALYIRIYKTKLLISQDYIFEPPNKYFLNSIA